MIELISRIVFGCAVMMSAFVSGSAQIIVFLSAFACGVVGGTAGAPTTGRSGDAGDLLLELRGDLVGIGITKVTHLGVAAGLQRPCPGAR